MNWKRIAIDIGAVLLGLAATAAILIGLMIW